MKTASIQQLLSPEAPPSPLSSRPERSAVERSAVPSSSYSPGSAALPFVISTGAQRSGEICAPLQQLLPPEVQPSPLSSRPERSAVERSAVPSSSYSPGSSTLPFVISTGAQRSGEICVPLQQLVPPEVPPSPLSSRPERSAVESSAAPPAATPPGSAALPFVISTGAQRSGEICGPLQQLLSRKRRPPLCHLDRSAA